MAHFPDTEGEMVREGVHEAHKLNVNCEAYNCLLSELLMSV